MALPPRSRPCLSTSATPQGPWPCPSLWATPPSLMAPPTCLGHVPKLLYSLHQGPVTLPTPQPLSYRLHLSTQALFPGCRSHPHLRNMMPQWAGSWSLALHWGEAVLHLAARTHRVRGQRFGVMAPSIKETGVGLEYGGQGRSQKSRTPIALCALGWGSEVKGSHWCEGSRSKG